MRVFISHATEDKDSVARPLAKALMRRGYRVWFDEFVLRLGDSLKREIDRGLAECDCGIVILSPSFFSKNWTKDELGGLVAREMADGEKLILPIWHDIDAAGIRKHSPTLADRIATSSENGTRLLIKSVVQELNYMADVRPVAHVEFSSPFGAALSVTARPNDAPTYDGDGFRDQFDQEMSKMFSTSQIEELLGGIEKKLRKTHLKKK